MSEKKERKSLKFLHDVKKGKDVNGFFVKSEELIVEGEDGITIKFFRADSKTKQKKVSVKKNKDGSFSVKSKIDGKEDSKTLTKDEIKKFIKDDKDLSFASDFLATQKGGAWLSRSSSKKASKKSSKKASKKSSKRKSSRPKVKKIVEKASSKKSSKKRSSSKKRKH